ncbi:MAG: hypothetical protein F4133_13995 [Gammaproteobacteria bacterium]|nr:hypothetical protein [Gammaproteobacteria bacterium]
MSAAPSSALASALRAAVAVTGHASLDLAGCAGIGQRPGASLGHCVFWPVSASPFTGIRTWLRTLDDGGVDPGACIAVRLDVHRLAHRCNRSCRVKCAAPSSP